MLLTYKKGDIFSRVTFSHVEKKFFLTTYRAETDSPKNATYTCITANLIMIETDNYNPAVTVGRPYNIPISKKFTDEGIETLVSTSPVTDLFVLGNNPQTITHAKTIILANLNKKMRKM